LVVVCARTETAYIDDAYRQHVQRETIGEICQTATAFQFLLYSTASYYFMLVVRSVLTVFVNLLVCPVLAY